jgi:Zn finger protein HypA/HybF involved in hydrogenase expression
MSHKCPKCGVNLKKVTKDYKICPCCSEEFWVISADEDVEGY